MFGIRDGAAWVADDVFVTRDGRSDVLVERWDGRGCVLQSFAGT